MCCEVSAHTRARSPAEPFPAKFPDHFSLISLFFLRFFRPELRLTPMFPVDTTIPPVSHLFPLHTANRGIGRIRGMTNRSISEFFSARSSSDALCSAGPLFPVLSVSSVVKPPRRCILSRPFLATRHQPLPTAFLTPIIPALTGQCRASPIIPALTQNTGGGGPQSCALPSRFSKGREILRFLVAGCRSLLTASLTPLFLADTQSPALGHIFYSVILLMLVGAPTFSTSQRRSEIPIPAGTASPTLLQRVRIPRPALFYNPFILLSHRRHHERSLSCHNICDSQWALRRHNPTMPIANRRATVDSYQCDHRRERCI